jgi:hypothetical protein
MSVRGGGELRGKQRRGVWYGAVHIGSRTGTDGCHRVVARAVVVEHCACGVQCMSHDWSNRRRTPLRPPRRRWRRGGELVYSLATAAPAGRCLMSPTATVTPTVGVGVGVRVRLAAGLGGRQRHMHVCCVESARMMIAESPLPHHRRESLARQAAIRTLQR